MCVVSALGEHYTEKFEPYRRMIYPNEGLQPLGIYQTVSRQEFEELRNLVLEMRDILLVGKAYDEKTNQPHCEHEEKVALLKEIAKQVGVDIDEVFK